MATSETLIDDVVEASGLARATIKGYVQRLRDAGLIQKTGRGASAAEMRTSDAAALLAAILADPIIAKGAVEAKAILSLPLHREIHLGQIPPTDTTKEDFASTGSFGSLLRWLISCAIASCEEESANLKGWQKLFLPGAPPRAIEICYFRNSKIAYFHVKHPPGNRMILEFSHEDSCDLDRRGKTPVEIASEMSPNCYLDARFAFISQLMVYAKSVIKPIAPAN